MAAFYSSYFCQQYRPVCKLYKSCCFSKYKLFSNFSILHILESYVIADIAECVKTLY